MIDNKELEQKTNDLINLSKEAYFDLQEQYNFNIIRTVSDNIKALSLEDWKKADALESAVLDTLHVAYNEGNPAGQVARKACDLHRQWLSLLWGKENYNRDAHRKLAEIYLNDPIQKEYFNKIGSSVAEFFNLALINYCNEEENIRIASMLESMGDYESRIGQIEAAEAHYEQAMELYQLEENNLGLAKVFHSLGDLESRLGQVDEAVRHYVQAGEIFQAEHDNISLANVLRSMGDLKYRYGQVEIAQRYYSHAEELYRIEKSTGLADVLQSLGELDIRLGLIDTAKEHFGKAEKLFRTQNDNVGLAKVLFNIGNLESREKETDQSRDHYAQAAELYCSEQDNLGLANVLLRMGDQESKLQHYELAINYQKNSYLLYDAENDYAGKSYAMGALCRNYALNGQVEEAKHWIKTTQENLDNIPTQVRPYVNGCIRDALGVLGINYESI